MRHYLILMHMFLVRKTSNIGTGILITQVHRGTKKNALLSYQWTQSYRYCGMLVHTTSLIHAFLFYSGWQPVITGEEIHLLCRLHPVLNRTADNTLWYKAIKLKQSCLAMIRSSPEDLKVTSLYTPTVMERKRRRRMKGTCEFH